MTIDPRGPILPILASCLVAIFLLVAMDSSPSSTPEIGASQASASEIPAAPPMPPPDDSGTSLPDAGDMPDTADLTDTAAKTDTPPALIPRPPSVPLVVSPTLPRTVARTGSPAVANHRSPTIARVIIIPPAVASPLAATAATTASSPIIPAPDTRNAPVPPAPSIPGPAEWIRPEPGNWRIVSGEVVGIRRGAVRSLSPPSTSPGDARSAETLSAGDAVADGSFLVPGDASVAPGPGAGPVRLHEATGRLGGEDAGYWISLLAGTLEWQNCDGGTVVCLGVRLRGERAHFRVTVLAAMIRITAIAGRVQIKGGAEPITLNANETVEIARDGEIQKGRSG